MDTVPCPIIDENTAHTSRGCYTLARIYRMGSDIVQVRIARENYSEKSCAVAELLTPDRRWTTLTNEPASRWIADTPTHPNPSIGRVLAPLADRLAHRAATILQHPAPQHHPFKSTMDTPPHVERAIRDGYGRVIISYDDDDHFLTVQVVSTLDGYDLRWDDGMSEFVERYPELSTAVARFGLLIAQVEHGGEAIPSDTASEFADTLAHSITPPPRTNSDG